MVLEEAGEQQISAYEERDQNGNITLLQQFNYDGDLETKAEYEFDDKNRVIVERQYTSEEKPDQTLRIEYNESGKAKRVIVEYADGSFSYKNYSRDEAEKSTTIEILDQDNDPEGKEYRKFDSEGRVLEEIIYTDSGAVETKEEFEYNDYGDVIERVSVDIDGFETVRFYDYYRDDQSRVNKIEVLNEDETIIRIDEFEYDERGNQTRHSMNDLDRGSLFVDERTYDLQNNEIRFERLMGDRPIEVTETKYRADGLMEQKESRRGDGVTINRYEYDLY